VQLHVSRTLDGADSVVDLGTTSLEVSATDLNVLLGPRLRPETGGALGILAIGDGVSEGLVSSKVDGELTLVLAEDLLDLGGDCLFGLDIGVLDDVLTVLDELGDVSDLGVSNDFFVATVNHERVRVLGGVDVRERLHKVGHVHIDTDDALELAITGGNGSRRCHHKDLGIKTKVRR